MEQIDLIHKMHELYPNQLKMVATMGEAEKAIKDGKIAGMIGVEGGYSIEGKLENLKKVF